MAEIQNTEAIKTELRLRFVTFRNAAKKLKVDYQYLIRTINGYPSYRGVLTALAKAEIEVKINAKVA